MPVTNKKYLLVFASLIFTLVSIFPVFGIPFGIMGIITGTIALFFSKQIPSFWKNTAIVSIGLSVAILIIQLYVYSAVKNIPFGG